MRVAQAELARDQEDRDPGRGGARDFVIPGDPVARGLHAVLGHLEQQPQAYRDSVLPGAVKARIAVEQGSTLGWERYVGPAGRVIGMKTFGASAPLKELQRKFGFEPERVVAAAKEMSDGREAPHVPTR